MAGAHPPAWYRDPRDPGRVRRWDGASWTDEVRPVPDWLRTLQLSAGPESSTIGRRRSGAGAAAGRRAPPVVNGSNRWLWWTSAALLLSGALVMAFLGLGERTPPDRDRLTDRSFARAADARCAAAGTLLGPDAGRAMKGDAEAERIERITAAWAATGDDLRALPVRREDAERVDGWLSTWDRWVALGAEYAGALREGADDDARAILAEASELKTSLRRFAVVNDMPGCAFG
jgi:hypothetical protein